MLAGLHEYLGSNILIQLVLLGIAGGLYSIAKKLK
jgi:hypothetical protein